MIFLEGSSNISEAIRAVLNLLFFLYKKILHAPKAPKAPKAEKTQKNTKSTKTQPSKGKKMQISE